MNRDPELNGLTNHVALSLQAHQAAMDEKVAEVANLTLRLREMSGKVMWHETQQVAI